MGLAIVLSPFNVRIDVARRGDGKPWAVLFHRY
jgi:hypothetical protein